MNDKPRRRWFAISLREVVLLTVVIGFAVAWYLEHHAWERDRQAWGQEHDLARIMLKAVDKVLAVSPDEPAQRSKTVRIDGIRVRMYFANHKLITDNPDFPVERPSQFVSVPHEIRQYTNEAAPIRPLSDDSSTNNTSTEPGLLGGLNLSTSRELSPEEQEEFKLKVEQYLRERGGQEATAQSTDTAE